MQNHKRVFIPLMLVVILGSILFASRAFSQDVSVWPKFTMVYRMEGQGLGKNGEWGSQQYRYIHLRSCSSTS